MTLRTIYKRYISPFIRLQPGNIPRLMYFARQHRTYRAMGGSVDSTRPILGEDTPITSIDPHYFYQAAWLARHIAKSSPHQHVDVGSQTNILGPLSAITQLTFVDIRPLHVALDNFKSIAGSVLDLPLRSASVDSLSCLHVIEHVGLGRYGDPLDPLGTRKACAELSRVLAPGGALYVSAPIGRERTEFNAHRVHRPRTLLEYFGDLRLVNFAAVSDSGRFEPDANIDDYSNARYALGLFVFSRDEKKA